MSREAELEKLLSRAEDDLREMRHALGRSSDYPQARLVKDVAALRIAALRELADLYERAAP